MDGWKTPFPLGCHLFRCHVGFREGDNPPSPSLKLFKSFESRLRIGGKLSDAVGRKPFLMLGPAANILFGPLMTSDLQVKIISRWWPEFKSSKSLENYIGCVHFVHLNPTLLHMFFLQQRIRQISNKKGLQFPRFFSWVSSMSTSATSYLKGEGQLHGCVEAFQTSDPFVSPFYLMLLFLLSGLFNFLQLICSNL